MAGFTNRDDDNIAMTPRARAEITSWTEQFEHALTIMGIDDVLALPDSNPTHLLTSKDPNDVEKGKQQQADYAALTTFPIYNAGKKDADGVEKKKGTLNVTSTSRNQKMSRDQRRAYLFLLKCAEDSNCRHVIADPADKEQFSAAWARFQRERAPEALPEILRQRSRLLGPNGAERDRGEEEAETFDAEAIPGADQLDDIEERIMTPLSIISKYIKKPKLAANGTTTCPHAKWRVDETTVVQRLTQELYTACPRFDEVEEAPKEQVAACTTLAEFFATIKSLDPARNKMHVSTAPGTAYAAAKGVGKASSHRATLPVTKTGKCSVETVRRSGTAVKTARSQRRSGQRSERRRKPPRGWPSSRKIENGSFKSAIARIFIPSVAASASRAGLSTTRLHLTGKFTETGTTRQVLAGR